ncbi:MAG: YggT family protein [Anaerolineae bacterium]|nr:YggT family protein [Anaerolineae bacterium]
MGFVITIIDFVFWLLWLLVLIRVLFSFAFLIPYHSSARRIVDALMPLYTFAERVTEPILAPIRNILPATAGLDFSPLIALLLLELVRRLLLSLLI